MPKDKLPKTSAEARTLPLFPRARTKRSAKKLRGSMANATSAPMQAVEHKSGVTTFRMAKGVHARIAAVAEREGMTLNRLIYQLVLEHLGKVGG